MSSHEVNTSDRKEYLTNGRDLYEVIEYSENFGLSKDKQPFLGATLEDSKTGKRFFIDALLILTLEEVQSKTSS